MKRLMGLLAMIFVCALVSAQVNLNTYTNVYGSNAVGDQCEITVYAGERVKPNLIAYDPDETEGFGPAGGIIWQYSSPFNSTGEWQTAMSDVGIHWATVMVSDGELTDKIDFCVEVLANNVAPVPQNLAYSINVGDTLQIEPVIFDPDSDKIYISYEEPLDENGEFFGAQAGDFIAHYYVSDGFEIRGADVFIRVLPSPYYAPEEEPDETVYGDSHEYVVEEGPHEAVQYVYEHAPKESDTIKLVYEEPRAQGPSGKTYIVSEEPCLAADSAMVVYETVGCPGEKVEVLQEAAQTACDDIIVEDLPDIESAYETYEVYHSTPCTVCVSCDDLEDASEASVYYSYEIVEDEEMSPCR